MAAKIRLAVCAQADVGTVPAGKQVIFIDSLDNVIKVKKDDQVVYPIAGTVNSVNGQVGIVVITPDDLDDTATLNKFVKSADLTKLGYITVTQSVDLDSIESLANAAIPSSQKGVANGVATLNGSGKVPLSQLDSAVMTYEGLWNASTNTPTLVNGTGDAGMIYIVSVSGSTDFGAGSISFIIGDWVIYNGTIWQRLINTNAVTSVNGKTGVVVLDKTDVGLADVDNTSDVNKPISTDVAIALSGKAATVHTHPLSDLTQSSATTGQVPQWNGIAWVATTPTAAPEWGDITGTLSDQTDLQSALNSKQDSITGNNLSFLGLDSSGDPVSIIGNSFNPVTGGANINHRVVIDNELSYRNVSYKNTNVELLQNSPNDSLTVSGVQIDIDQLKSGFDFGTSNNSARFLSHNLNHNGSSNVGTLEFIQNNFNLGNGTDPIDVKGLNFLTGYGNINANVNISNSIQGYGFQFDVSPNASFSPGAHVNAFFDNANIQCPSRNHTSFNAIPNIAEVMDNSYVNAFNVYPNIAKFTGSAGFTGLGMGGNYGIFDTGSWNGVNINPNVTMVQYATGISVDMTNVNVVVGAKSTLTVQDLSFEFLQTGSYGNAFTLEYTSGATAGAEVVNVVGTVITVQIEDGVSTADQIKTAVDGFFAFNDIILTTVSGTGTNVQTVMGPVNFTGGINQGSKLAARFKGDVRIDGGFQFSGSLQIGKLNGYASEPIVDGGGDITSTHELISEFVAPDNATIANVDTIGLITAAVINVGANTTITSNFLGISALALPASINIQTGANVQIVAGATFALSLEGGGGTIDNAYMCRALTIPDGVTTINNLRGFAMDLPFGDPGTNTWGVYITPAVHNYMAGNLKVGGIIDTAAAGYALDIMGPSRMETTAGVVINANDTGLGFFDNTPVAQQISSGPATATAVYTTTEQAMIQEMYDALRSYGLLT